jgi:hypothetical protein
MRTNPILNECLGNYAPIDHKVLLLPSWRQSRDKIVSGCLGEKIPAVLLARDRLRLAVRFARRIVPNLTYMDICLIDVK